MRRFLVTVTILTYCIANYAQDKNEIKALEFSAKSGTLIKKEFFEIGNINKNDIKFDVITFEDVINRNKEGLLRITTTRYTSLGERSYDGSLNYDEVDGCIQSMRYINDNIINTTPTTYTEFIYRTVDGVQFGAYWSQSKKESTWVVFIQTKNLDRDSIRFLNKSEIGIIITLLTSSKNKMKELLETN